MQRSSQMNLSEWKTHFSSSNKIEIGSIWNDAVFYSLQIIANYQKSFYFPLFQLIFHYCFISGAHKCVFHSGAFNCYASAFVCLVVTKATHDGISRRTHTHTHRPMRKLSFIAFVVELSFKLIVSFNRNA